MKFSLSNLLKTNTEPSLVVLLGAQKPNQDVLDALSRNSDLTVREAFTTRGVLQDLPGVHLVILDELISLPDTSNEVLHRALEMSSIPMVSQEGFLADPNEWLGRARLTNAKRISFLPARQINLVNWSGGVGKTTLAMAICKRFVQRTGLPAALLELSMGGSALHARITHDLPEFFSIATHKEEPALWYGDSDDEPVIIEPGKEHHSFDPAFPKRKGKVLETQEETHLWQCLHAARMSSLNLKRLKSISDVIDWEDVSTKIKVPHDGNYPVPKGEHGTHVAGILGANWPSNPELNSLPEGQDIVGMCPDIKFYDLRVFADTSNGEEGIFQEMHQVTDEFTVICALEFIRFLNRKREELKVHGVNLSLSIPHDVASFACGCTPVCNECARLVDAGVVVVAAAGNHGFDERSIPFSQGGEYRDISISDPGNAEEAITVGSTHRDHPHTYGISYFSGRGPTGDGRRKPDLVAPGEKIIAPVPGERFACKDGTSMAAPHVSGAAALLMARYPELIGNPRRIKQILCETATDLGRERYFQGHGLLDVLRAMQSL